MIDRLLDFAGALRAAGVPVSVGEDLDAVRAIGLIPLEDRDVFRSALAATMLKSAAHREAFDTLFSIYFDGAGPEQLRHAEAPEDEVSPERFIEKMMGPLGAGDAAATRSLAAEAVDRFGRVEDSPSGSLFFQYPVFRALDPGTLRARFAGSTDWDAMDPLEQRLTRDRFERSLRDFRREVKAEVDRRVARRRGPDKVARHAVRPLPANLDLATASADEIARLRRTIRPLARKLATRASLKRRRARKGNLDVRNTIRHSLSSGGVPFETRFKHKPPHRPELFVLCDVSTSVARFARFSLMLVHALSSQFSKVRSFVFIDDIDEVTRLFEREDLMVAIDRINDEANVVWIDGHSNYAASLERFEERWGADLTSRTTILILGDARNNYRQPRPEVLQRLARKARHVYWLNPEPLGFWDSGDSAASVYEEHVEAMVEVRNLSQLEHFIERVL